jgi:hypothetical protein
MPGLRRGLTTALTFCPLKWTKMYLSRLNVDGIGPSENNCVCMRVAGHHSTLHINVKLLDRQSNTCNQTVRGSLPDCHATNYDFLPPIGIIGLAT